MRPNKDRRTGIILYGLLLIPLLFAAAALAQATEQAQGLAEITAALSTILNNPMALKWCASTPKFLLAVLMLYPLAVYCYMLDQADRHPGAEHGTAKWGSAHRLNIKYRNTKDSKENYILTENVRFSTDSHAHTVPTNIFPKFSARKPNAPKAKALAKAAGAAAATACKPLAVNCVCRMKSAVCVTMSACC